MLIVGLVLIGVSILGGIIAVVAFTVSSSSKLEDFASSTHSIDQHVTVDGLGDHQWFIYQDPNVMTGASCTVLDEQGNDVTTHSADLNMTFNDLSFQAIQTFESSAGGVYDISCTDYPVILGGALPLGGIFGAGISGLVAGLVFLVGAVLTIIGLVRRSKSKRPIPHGGSLPGYGPGQQPPSGATCVIHMMQRPSTTITSSVAGYILASIVVGVLGLVAAIAIVSGIMNTFSDVGEYLTDAPKPANASGPQAKAVNWVTQNTLSCRCTIALKSLRW